MSSELTDKTHCVVTRSAGRYYVNKIRFESITAIITNPEAPRFLDIDGDLIALSDIASVVEAAKIVELDHTKHGDWKCKYDYWHERGQSCAHGQLRR